MGALRQLRATVAAALEGIDDDWTVLAGPADQVDPPCYVVQWGPDDWRTAGTYCTDQVNIEIVVVASRLGNADELLDTLEDMVDAAYASLMAAGLRPRTAWMPAGLEIGNHPYLAARLHLTQPVTIGA